MTRAVVALTSALEGSQAEMALRVEEEMAKLGSGIGNDINVMTREFSALGKAVDSEHQREGRQRRRRRRTST